MPPIEVTTVGAAFLSVGMFATTLAWKILPSRKSSNLATDIALVKNEIQHIRQDIREIKDELARLR